MIKHVAFGVLALFLLIQPVAAQSRCVNCQPRLPSRGQVQSVGKIAPQVAFAKSIEDLPVMSGFDVDVDKDVLFIFGQDRIAQTTLRGYVDVDQVYYFYWQTLKEMGWQDAGRNVYERNGETLTMKVRAADQGGQTVVTFAVQPSGTN